MDILAALFVTLILESPFWLLTRRKDIFGFALMLLMNLITNIGMNLLYVDVFSYAGWFVPCAEIFVFLGESLILYRLDGRRQTSFLIGLVANALSLAGGEILNRLLVIFDWPLDAYSFSLGIIVLFEIISISILLKSINRKNRFRK